MKHLFTILLILTFGQSFGQKKQCHCDEDTFMNNATTNCKTIILKNKSKLYWQYNCNRIWLTLENPIGKKKVINEVDYLTNIGGKIFPIEILKSLYTLYINTFGVLRNLHPTQVLYI